MNSKFETIYQQIMRSLINENDDMASVYVGNRRMSRADKGKELIYHFYDKEGDDKYILSFRNVNKFIPPSVERLTDEFLNSGEANKYDKMNAANVNRGIVESLTSFYDEYTNAISKGLSRDDIKRKNPFEVGRTIDNEFGKYYAWKLVSSDGVTYAWCKHEDEQYRNFHLGKQMPRNIFPHTIDKFNIDNSKPDEQNICDYEIRFYDKDDINTYTIPFKPIGAWAFENPRWRKIDQLSAKSMTTKKPECQAAYKFLNDAIDKFVDKQIKLSDTLPATSGQKQYPLTAIDNDFLYERFEVYRNGLLLCTRGKQGYVKMSNVRKIWPDEN